MPRKFPLIRLKRFLENNLRLVHSLHANPVRNSKKDNLFFTQKKGAPMKFSRVFTMLLASLLLTMMASSKTSHSNPPLLPNPVLYMTSTESYTTSGKNWIRYKFDVLNKDAYPDAMFAPAPALPPCGANTKSSRTWVDIYDQSGKRLYGFCALGKSENLGSIWFALEDGVIPPSYIYIELNDRETNTKYKSNLAETAL
jgi:hypothetical protein